MAGRRLNPDPPGMQPVSEIVDPMLAAPISHGNPVGSPPMGYAAMAYNQQNLAQQEAIAQQMAQQDMAGFDVPLPGQRPPQRIPGVLPGQDPQGEPFAKFHSDGEPGTPPPAQEKVTELSADQRASFAMLMHIGRMTKTIDVYGHPVAIQSLSVGDDLLIGMYRKPFLQAPPAHERAYQIGVVAAGTMAMDNQPVYTPLSMEESSEEIFRKKVAKVEQFYPATVTAIYRAILDLDQEFAELADQLGKRKG